MAAAAKKESTGLVRHVSIFGGTLLSIWSAAAMLSGLAQADWQVSELLRQYLMAIGLMQEHHTFTDFYTHIKGVEYIIALAFLTTFPALFKFMNKAGQEN